MSAISMLSEKERLLRVLSREEHDRPPVIAPGGMMSALTTDLLESHGIDGARSMLDAEVMAQAATAARDAIGIENLGVPFCLTVEAEALGADTSRGTSTVEPMCLQPALASARDVPSLKVPDPWRDRRMSQVLLAVRLLKSRFIDVPIIGNLSGPVTLATSILPCEDFLRLLLKDRTLARRIIEVARETISSFGVAMIESGADVITVSDPTASGEIIGPRIFDTYFLPEYRDIFSRFHTAGANTILHICGNVQSILPSIGGTGADAFSVDAVMGIRQLRKELGSMPVMGNTSTILLAQGTPRAIARVVRAALSEGVDIAAPSCGLGRDTPLQNVRLMCEIVKTWERSQAGRRQDEGEGRGCTR
ncbi:MAG: uroporphyrinogen decarboxylase [Chloroflexota bacterium]|nr:MAG: uroporphyrinogen decarboxylase [Chloroflexota bacterium]